MMKVPKISDGAPRAPLSLLKNHGPFRGHQRRKLFGPAACADDPADRESARRSSRWLGAELGAGRRHLGSGFDGGASR